MKNIFRTLAIVALGFFATSCVSADVDEVQMASGDGVVNFTLAAPQHNSRVIADGKSATDLTCAVYDANWNYLTTVKGEFTGGALTTTVSIRLVNAKTYNFVFWAEVPGNPHYTKNFGTTPGEQVLEPNITVNYNSNVAGDANDETRDAFFGKLLNLTINGTMNEYVPLKRPFAQINFGTLDTEAAKVGGFDITTATVSKFTTRAYTTLNLANGEATNEVDVEFTDNELPVEDLYLMADTQKTTPYNWLAMNYILWPETEGSLSTCTMVITDNDTTPESVEIKYPNAPVRRNWRTDLVGNLLTDNVIIEVEILPIPEGDLPNTPASNLAQAAVVGGEVTLTEDMTLSNPLTVLGDFTLDLNGKTLSAALAGAVIKVEEGGILRLKGGVVENTEINGGAVILNKGQLVLDGVTVKGAPIADGAYPEYAVVTDGGELVVEDGTTIVSDRGAISLRHGANATINGGHIEVTDALGTRNLTAHAICVRESESKLTINGGNFVMNYNPGVDNGASVICPWGGTIVIYDGNFAHNGTKGQAGIFQNYMGPGSVSVYGGTYNDDTITEKNNVAAGYEALLVDGIYHVLPEAIADAATTAGVTAVTESSADVTTAIATNNGETTLYVWNDVAYVAKYGEVAISASAEGTTTTRAIVEGSAVKTATVAEGVEVVGNRTFRNCSSLQTITLPNTLTEIQSGAFQGCSALTSVTIPAGVTTIGDQAFYGCSALTQVNIPEGVTRIEASAFRALAVEEMTIPASVTYIGQFAFRENYKMRRLYILSENIDTIETNAFLWASNPDATATLTIYVKNQAVKEKVEAAITQAKMYVEIM